MAAQAAYDAAKAEGMPPDLDMQSLVDLVPKPGSNPRSDRDLPLPTTGPLVSSELRIDWTARWEAAQVLEVVR